ncbi:MAG: FHA domain-containing protein [Planctomycetota bacterium]
MATLLVISGPSEGRYYPLNASRLVSIGRDDQCSIQIVDDGISRRHLQIRYEQADDHHVAVDMRSANGVYVNGRRIVQESALRDGDIIGVGRSKLRYTRQDFSDADSAWEHYQKTDEWRRGTLVLD